MAEAEVRRSPGRPRRSSTRVRTDASSSKSHTRRAAVGSARPARRHRRRREAAAAARRCSHEHKLSIYPLFALGVLSIVDTFQGYAFRVLAPEISATLGVSKGAIAGVLALTTLASALGPLPIAALAAQKARRALLIVVTGIAWSLVAITTGFVTALAGLVARARARRPHDGERVGPARPAAARRVPAAGPGPRAELLRRGRTASATSSRRCSSRCSRRRSASPGGACSSRSG